jgi:hypothetical protein
MTALSPAPSGGAGRSTVAGFANVVPFGPKL